MFERVRHSRSKRSKASRQTQRANQRGGDFTVIAATNATDIAIWHAGIDAAGLGTGPLDLKILFTTTDVLTTDDTPEKKATRINTWFRFIGEQDTVALIAITHVQREFLKRVLAGTGGSPAVNPLVNGTKTYATDAAIDPLKGEELTELVLVYVGNIKADYTFLSTLLQRLCKQFDAIINMGAGTMFGGGIPTNKFEEMFRSDQRNKDVVTGGPILYNKMIQELIGVMINPQRMQNVLMQEVSKIVRMYKDIAVVSKDISTIHPVGVIPPPPPANIVAVDNNEIKLNTIVDKVSQSIFSNTMTLTGKEVVDGWVLGGSPVYFKGARPKPSGSVNYYHPYPVYKFVDHFYRTLAANFNPASKTFTVSRVVATPGISPLDDAFKYGILAAKLLIAKLNGQALEPTITLKEMYRGIDSNTDALFLLYLQHQLNKP
jgi:hypothetical protein